MSETIKALVEGGKASAGPPLGPALGPMGVNIMQVINTINDKTKEFNGMKVPVKVIIDPVTKNFEIKVGTPPAASLIINEMGGEKGASSPSRHTAGNITIDQAIKVAKMKFDSLEHAVRWVSLLKEKSLVKFKKQLMTANMMLNSLKPTLEKLLD